MKKLSILMTGALLAVLILQGCSKEAETSAPAQDQSTVQPPKDITHPAIPLGLIALTTGAGGQPLVQSALLTGSGQPMINLITDVPGPQVVDTLYRQPDRSFGISNQVLAEGQGLVGVGVNPPGCPVTGACACTLIGAAVNCRGDNVAGNTQAIIRLTNNTAAGGVGACAMYGNSICKNDTDCYPNATGAALAFECTFPAALVGADGIYGTGDDGPICGADGICNAPPPGPGDDPVDWDGADNLPNTGDEPNPGTNCTNPAVPGVLPAGSAATANAALCLAGTVCTEVNELGVPLGQQRYCLGLIITDNAAGNAVGYCLDGYHTCNDNAIASDGLAASGLVKGKIFTACGAGTCDVVGGGGACLTAADCLPGGVCVPNPNGPPIGTGANAATCWTGCGPAAVGPPPTATGAPDCVPGRNLNCVQVQYDGSQAAGSTYDAATATTYPKCTLAPYAAVGYNNAPANDAWLAGSIPLAGPGSAVVTLALSPYDADYCVHYFNVSELASGDAVGCATTCGDGWVAFNNGELCEPIDDLTATGTDIGCPAGERCDVAGLCKASVTNPDGCYVPVASCGNGIIEPGLGETCDPGAPANSICCSPATCTYIPLGGANPQGVCPGGTACVDAVCNGAGACTTQNKAAGTACGGSAVACDALDTCDGAGTCTDVKDPLGFVCAAAGADPTCDPADTCDGVGNACPSTFAPGGTNCGGAPSGLCDLQDTCNGAGACTANVSAAGTPCAADSDGAGCDKADTCDGVLTTCTNTCEAAGTACNPPAGGTCDGLCPGTCATGGPIITSVAPIKGTSPGYGDPATGDYNNGMTGGPAGLEWVVILPNDPDVTGTGTDNVRATVNFSAAIAAGATVTCTAGGNAMNEADCGAGDVSCVVFGPHPELTAVVTDIQSNANPITGTFPDEFDTARNISVSCILDNDGAGPTPPNGAVQVTGDVGLGFVGVRDEVKAAGAAGTLAAKVFVYCSNGVTEKCDGVQGAGGPIDGVWSATTTLHYNPAIFTSVGGVVLPADRANPANAYGIGAAPCRNNGCASCTASAPAGTANFLAPCNSCPGWAMAHLGDCNLNYVAQVAGTKTTIDATAISADATLGIIGDGSGFIRGVDGITFAPLPSTNVTGNIDFQ